jgi:hypothetical protein
MNGMSHLYTGAALHFLPNAARRVARSRARFRGAACSNDRQSHRRAARMRRTGLHQSVTARR